MDANRSSLCGRRVKGLVGALAAAAFLLAGASSLAVSAAPGAGHTAADGAGTSATSDLARVAVDSPPMIQAELIAVKYWGTSPCSGVVAVSWATLAPTVNAASNWWNPQAAYGNADANSQCRITFNQAQRFDWPMFCTVMVHEIGHLTGHQHATDQTSVMYPIYVAPIPECTGTPAGAVPVAGPAGPQAVTSSGGHTGRGRHKARSGHKAHRRPKHA